MSDVKSEYLKENPESVIQKPKFDLLRATVLSPDIKQEIESMFLYHPWNSDQVAHGEAVRNVLIHAVGVIIEHCPPGPDRTVAIRKLREARMDANSAITHGGKY